MVLWILFFVALFLFYKWGTSTFDYFEERGIPYNKPWPFFGSRIGMFLRNSSTIDFIMELYNEFKDDKISGMFEFRFPSYFIRDPEIIKKLTVKEFESFPEHRNLIPVDSDPIFGKSLFFMTGQDWKDMRSTMSPAFTGKKMRLMFGLMNEVGAKMSKTLKNKIINGASRKFEFKEFARKFSIDMIATTAFGIEINSFEDPNNDFMRHTSKATDFNSFSSVLKLAGYFVSGRLMKFLNLRFFNQDTINFFQTTIIETMNERQKKGIVRHDFVDLLMEVKKGTLNHDEIKEEEKDSFATVQEHDVGKSKTKRQWDDEYLVAQSFGFFFAGYETISTAMTFMVYELIRNPDIQKKLQNEIDEVQFSLKEKDLSYEDFQKMKFLDQVVSETLRMYPSAPIVDRSCAKDFELEYDGKKLLIEKGRNFYIPIYAIQHNPEYFPDPEKFDPERFSDENKHKINRDAYLPFGSGPRNCVGSRFALMEMKAIFYYLLLNFNFEATEDTQIPIKLAKNQVMFALERGLDFALVPRN